MYIGKGSDDARTLCHLKWNNSKNRSLNVSKMQHWMVCVTRIAKALNKLINKPTMFSFLVYVLHPHGDGSSCCCCYWSGLAYAMSTRLVSSVRFPYIIQNIGECEDKWMWTRLATLLKWRVGQRRVQEGLNTSGTKFVQEALSPLSPSDPLSFKHCLLIQKVPMLSKRHIDHIRVAFQTGVLPLFKESGYFSGFHHQRFCVYPWHWSWRMEMALSVNILFAYHRPVFPFFLAFHYIFCWYCCWFLMYTQATTGFNWNRAVCVCVWRIIVVVVLHSQHEKCNIVMAI